jgi:hypothetical protein
MLSEKNSIGLFHPTVFLKAIPTILLLRLKQSGSSRQEEASNHKKQKPSGFFDDVHHSGRKDKVSR